MSENIFDLMSGNININNSQDNLKKEMLRLTWVIPNYHVRDKQDKNEDI